ncbi:MAG: rhodanese-like domain-containing protein [Planctomycetota bacterium]|nr:MAG: rhodanese-like domain-containing protein [Planctomycetota bacterium]
MRNVAPEKIGEWTGKFIDVRNFDEFTSERLDKARCVPLDRVMTEASKWDTSEQILLICKSGMRSSKAGEQLEQAGFTQVYTVPGGLDACKNAGLNIIVERKTIPVYRQVMIGAGIVLLIGLGLSFINPWFILIDWFAAAMLFIAGVTGFCPMMKILSKMPWNAQAVCPPNTTNAKG